MSSRAAVEAVWRIESARLIGGLARMVRDVSLAEDLAQDALVAALERWPRSGVPDNPGAWLMATAKHRAIDLMRRAKRLETKQQGMLGGLSTPAIARAFLVPEATVAQRIVRAKKALSAEQVPFAVPSGDELAPRLASVLEVVYLIFNEGYATSDGDDWMRPALCPAGAGAAALLIFTWWLEPAGGETVSDVDQWLSDFDKALSEGDSEAAAALFHEESFWRDLVAFTWNIKTAEGPDEIKRMLDYTLEHTQPSGWHTTEPPDTADGITTAWIAFETASGRGSGLLRLRDGKAWTLLTALDELSGHEEPRGPGRPHGVEHGADRDRQTWLEARLQEAEQLGYVTQPYVLIVGGGQGGIALGARLRQLGVPTIIAERNPRPGDSWRRRYKSLCLHDPVWYDHLPYIKFPENWPVFSPKDKIGDWLEMYTRVMELNYWGSTVVKSASYDEDAGEWVVHVEREGQAITLRPKQLVLAMGMSSRPNLPAIPGMDVFKGEQHHSSQHPGPDGYVGKRVVVVGSNNSAHDICAALWETGVDVTMVQRSPTHIVRSATLMEIGLGALYSEEAVAAGITTEKADMIFASLPYRILHEFQIPLYDQMRERDADFYKRLEDAGFQLDWGEDNSGLFMKYLRRGSGYYIDVGASELVASGDVKLKVGQVARLTEGAVVMDDGTELPADVVVYATGYASMNGHAADLISQDVADRVGKVWGLGSDTKKDPGPWEGEQRNMWKPTQQDALWFHGGNLHQSRHYSLYLALQLKAREAGLETPVYGLQEVHHLA